MILNNKFNAGLSTELTFERFCIENGWEYCKPCCFSLPYDYVMRLSKDEEWQTIQIKKSYKYKRKKGNKPTVFRVPLKRSNNKKYEPGDFDQLYVYIKEWNVWYSIPYEAVEHIKHQIIISHEKWQKYRVASGCESFPY